MERLYKQVRLQELSEDDVFQLRYTVPERKLVLPVSDADSKQENDGNDVMAMGVEELLAKGVGSIRDEKRINMLIDLISNYDNQIWTGEVRELTLTEQSHIRKAFYNLNYYEPRDDSNIEKVQGYLEAFHHLCELSEWGEATKILWIRMDTPTQEELDNQLGIWGYYRETIELYSRLLGKLKPYSKLGGNLNDFWNSICLNGLGNAYNRLGEYQKARDYYEQIIVRERGDIYNIYIAGCGLGNLGTSYCDQGQYQKAIDYFQKHLEIARKIGDRDRLQEVYALGNLGNAYNYLKQYQKARDYLQ